MKRMSKMRGMATIGMIAALSVLCVCAIFGWVYDSRSQISVNAARGGPPVVWDPVVEETEIGVENVTLFHDNGTEVGFKVAFTGTVRSYGVLASTDLSADDWFRDGFLFNGKAMREICEYGETNACPVRACMEDETSITIWINQKIPQENGGLMRDADGNLPVDSLGHVKGDGNEVTISKELRFPNGAKMNTESDVVYEYKKGSWAYRYTGDVSDVEWTDVDILGIGNPVLYTGDKIQYEITFAENVATKQYIHVNAGADWLLATGAGGLTAEEIGKLTAYGIFDSVLDKIEISVNGEKKTVRGWQDSDPNDANWSACVLNVHYNQQTGLNTMQILWCGKRIPEGGTVDSATQPLCPPLDAEISITFKAGFRTPAFQQIAEDITYEYSGKQGATFVRKANEKVYDTITFDKVLYNGVAIEPNGRVELPTGSRSMDKNLFTVLFKEGNAISYTIANISDLRAGDNTVTITATSGDTAQTFTFTAVCVAEQAKEKGCGSWAGAGSLLFAVLALIGATVAVICMRGRRSAEK